MTTKSLRLSLEKKKAIRQEHVVSCEQAKIEEKTIRRDLTRYEQALEIVKLVGLQTQQQFQYQIADIVSMALDAVLPDPYELKVEFVERRNKTECDIYFSREGKDIDPLSASGGGAVDIAAFALRIASWIMMSPRPRNTIILDEPLRFLSQDMQEKASKMIQELANKIGIQFIIVTHDDVLASYADKTFSVVNKKGVSKIM